MYLEVAEMISKKNSIMKYYLLLLAVVFNSIYAVGNGDLSNDADSASTNEVLTPIEKPNSIQRFELTLPDSVVKTIEKKLIEKDKSLFDKYGAILIAVIALIGSFITTIVGNRNTRINLSNQMKATEDNLKLQIRANKELEREKMLLESNQEKKNDLKELVARFIKNATLLNLKLNEIIYSDIEEGRIQEANDKYDNTYLLRNELKGIYYSIKVALDGSQKQQDLERSIDRYMNTVDFSIDIERTQADMYEQPIGELYHKIKAIIHENYSAPQ